MITKYSQYAYTCIYMYKQTLSYKYHSDTCSVIYWLTDSFSFEVDIFLPLKVFSKGREHSRSLFKTKTNLNKIIN